MSLQDSDYFCNFRSFLMTKRLTLRNTLRGFTLIEIMVVVVIIGILASLVIPRIIGRPQQARIVKAKQDILAIENAMQLYKLDNGFYPSAEQGIAALVSKPGSDPVPTNWQPYLKEVPQDPWGKPYHYANPGQHSDIDIYTYGPTGQPGGSGENAEIGNWGK
jgi:general secretion pathway protein G